MTNDYERIGFWQIETRPYPGKKTNSDTNPVLTPLSTGPDVMYKLQKEAEEVDQYFRDKYPNDREVSKEAYVAWLKRNYPKL